MDTLKIAKLNDEALSLFKETKAAMQNSKHEDLQKKAKDVPTQFVDRDKKVSIVFAGQYSAGKSTILSYLTGQKLEIGQGVTTSKCQFLDWNGIEVVDTPGIHTQKRPDHDAITYDAMSKADLIVFVCTAEGFSEGLGKHFRKLLIEKGKGNEMMLVFNKMEDSLYGNTPEGQKEFFKKDVQPVIAPFTAEDLYVTYIDMCAYGDALEDEGEEREAEIKMSGWQQFVENMNAFIDKKKVLGKCTTSLYQLDQLLTDAQSDFKSNDSLADGTRELLTQQRKRLVDAKDNIKSKSYSIVRRNTQNVRVWGNDIANKLTSKSSENEVNSELQRRYDDTNAVYQKAAKELEQVIGLECEELQKQVDKMNSSEFASNLRRTFEERIGKINMRQRTHDNMGKFANGAKNAGSWLDKFATGPNAQKGWDAIFKLGNYSGSGAHQAVLKVGHLVGHKFKPWEAVKMAGKIGKVGKFLGVGGALIGVGLQIWDDQQEEKVEKQLTDQRCDIRNSFDEAANVIDMRFDEDTQTWVEDNIDPKIKEIDSNIKAIDDSRNIDEKEYRTFQDLQKRTKKLISKVQDSVA